MKTENKKFLKSMRPRLNFLIVLMLITSLLHLFGIVHTSQNCKNKYGDKVACVYFKEPKAPCTDYDCVVFTYSGILLSLYLLILQIPSVSKFIKSIISKQKYLSLLFLSPFFIALGLNIDLLVRYYQNKKNKENYEKDKNDKKDDSIMTKIWNTFIDIIFFLLKAIMIILILLVIIAICSDGPATCLLFFMMVNDN
tara:strand:+ start:2033 stop:2620 length:588 start_codon:yes stop_codon:yes gene_type:complete